MVNLYLCQSNYYGIYRPMGNEFEQLNLEDGLGLCFIQTPSMKIYVIYILIKINFYVYIIEVEPPSMYLFFYILSPQ